MALSGYKTQTNFLKYSKVTGKERAKWISTVKRQNLAISMITRFYNS